MGQFLRLVLQFLRCRMSHRKICIFLLLISLLFIFVLINKNHYHSSDLVPFEYSEKTTKLRTLKESVVQSNATIRNIIETPFSLQPTTTLPKAFASTKAPRQTNQVQGRVLLMYDFISTHTAKGLKVILDSLRVPVDTYKYRLEQTISLTEEKDTASRPIGKYSLLIFADHISFFHKWTPKVRDRFTNYSRQFNVTTIFIPQDGRDLKDRHYHHLFSYKGHSSLPLTPTTVDQVHISTKLNLHYSKNNLLLPKSLIAKSGVWHTFPTLASAEIQNHIFKLVNRTNCTGPHPRNHRCNLPSQLDHLINRTQFSASNFEEMCTWIYTDSQGSINKSPCILNEQATEGGPQIFFIGTPINFWLTKILLMDLLRLFSRTRVLRFDRKRSILIDIDDIFVAPEGLKMNKNDVQALVQTQEKLRSFVPGLTFNLGFCGAYYKRGTPAEVEGSHELVRRSNNFQWFGHIFNHLQPHLLPLANLTTLMTQSKQFAQNTSIAVGHGYSVSPHHSGVYPVYPPLYKTWGRIWNVTMTTTEEYPNIYPEHLRRGFIHRGIMVLPRQTCRLFTHTISYETFPGGKEAFHEAGNGGTVFNTLLFNPISIFMTHVTNYATDRLALQLFSDLFQFTRTWTNLELTTDRPLNLGKRYFDIFPEDKAPIWGSPCGDKRHIDIYPPSKNCTRLPSLLILGPQKTGTTALYTFLKEHPLISANKNNKDHYEEVQFFSNETLYNYGVEWYMEQFPVPHNNQVIFEKSATYFTHPLAPKRVKALLPNIKLVVILLDPVNRAYSWYQHMQAHNSPVALKYTFSEVIGSNSASNITDRGLLSLRQHCLSPGQYQRHLNLWLDHFLPEQLLLIDGETLAIKPSIVMETVQEFLNLEMLDYNEILKWNSGKGFYCVNNHCLGPSKGRKYPDIAVGDLKFLEQYYRVDNVKLAQLLRRHVKTPIPDWLTTQLSAIRS